MTSETDSEIIIRVLEKARASGKNTGNAVEEVLDKVWGNMAVALLDKDKPCVWLFRNNNPIHVFVIPKHIFGQEVYFFASLSAIFDDAWKTTFGNRYEKDGVESVYLQQNKLYSISPIKKFIRGAGWCRFIVYNIKVDNKFEKARQYSSNNVRSTKYYNQTLFWSSVIDASRPQLGLRLSSENVQAIKSKMKEKDGKEKIKIDGLTPIEFASLKTLVDGLFKSETAYFLSEANRPKIEGENVADKIYNK